MYKWLLVLGLLFVSCLPFSYLRTKSYINGVPVSGEAVCQELESCKTAATTFCGKFPDWIDFWIDWKPRRVWDPTINQWTTEIDKEYIMLFQCYWRI